MGIFGKKKDDHSSSSSATYTVCEGDRYGNFRCESIKLAESGTNTNKQSSVAKEIAIKLAASAALGALGIPYL